MRYKLLINDYDALENLYKSTSNNKNYCKNIRCARKKASELLCNYGRPIIIGGSVKVEIRHINGKTKEFIT